MLDRINANNIYKKFLSLSEEERYYIWTIYLAKSISLKNTFTVYDLSKDIKGLGKPDKRINDIGFYYLWKNSKIKTYDEFTSLDNFYINEWNDTLWFNHESIFRYIEINMKL